MTDREKLEENYEDALFALLMDDIAREESERLLRENEALQADPDAPRPNEARCLRTIRRAAARRKMAGAARRLGKASGRAAAAVLVFVMLAAGAYTLSPGLRAGTVDLLQGMDRRAEARQSAEAVPALSPAPEDAFLPPAATDEPVQATSVPAATDEPAPTPEMTRLPATEPPKSSEKALPAETDAPMAAVLPAAVTQPPAAEEKPPVTPEPPAPEDTPVPPEPTQIPAAEEDMPAAIDLAPEATPEPLPIPTEAEEPPVPEDTAVTPEPTQAPAEEEDMPTAIGLAPEDAPMAADAVPEDEAMATPAPEPSPVLFDPGEHVPEGYALTVPEGEPSPAPVPGQLRALYTGPEGETVLLEMTAVTDETAPDCGAPDADPGETVVVGRSLAALTDKDGERRICWLDEARQLWVSVTASDMTREQLIAYAAGLFPAD